MNAFAWLNNLMEWFARWVPRLALVRATHVGVLFGRGGRVTELPPGLWWYWPITSELQQVATTERTIITCAQLVDDRLIAFVLVWRVLEPAVVLRRYRKVDGRLENEARTRVFEHRGDMPAALSDVRSTFTGHLEIISLAASSDGAGFALKQFDDYGLHERQEPSA